MNHKLLLTCIFLLFWGALFAQDRLVLDLREAQEYAIENNRTLKSAELDIAKAELQFKQAVAQGLPQVDASLDYTNYFNYEIEFDLGFGADFSSISNEQMNQAMTKTLSEFSGDPAMGLTGATPQDIYNYQAGSYYSQELSSMLPGTKIKMTHASTGTIQLGQLIYSGQYWVGLQTAKLGKQIAEHGYENSILDVKQSVINSYFMILVTEKSLEIIKESISDLKEIEGHTRNMYDNGMAEQTDVDQISIQVNMLENNRRSIERTVKVGYNLLKFQLGVDYATEVELSEPLGKLLGEVVSEDSEGNSIKNNPVLKLTEASEAMSEQMVKMEKMAYTPTVSGFYAFNQKFLATGLDMTPPQLVGVTMNIPVFSSGLRKHKVAQARLEAEQARLEKETLTESLLMQEKQLMFDLNSAIENYEAQKENVEVAKRVYKNVNDKFEQGVVSSLDLTQSNSNYLQAETNFVQATLALVQAQIALDKLYNNL